MSNNGTRVQDRWNSISLFIIMDIDHIMWHTTVQRRCQGSKHHQQLLSFSSFPHFTCDHKATIDVIVVMDTTNVYCRRCQAGASRNTFYEQCSTCCSHLSCCCSCAVYWPARCVPPKLSTSTTVLIVMFLVQFVSVCCWARQQLTTFLCIEDWFWVFVKFMKFFLTSH